MSPDADESRISSDVRDHGTALDERRIKVQCNYCSKIVSGFFRLKCHLGGIRKDVVPCEKVPENVRELLSNIVLEARGVNLGKELANSNHRKRSSSANLSSTKHMKTSVNQSAGAKSHRSSATSKESVNGGEAKGHVSVEVQRSIGRIFYEMGIDLNASTSCFKRLIIAFLGNSQLRYKMPTPLELKGWILQDEVKEMQEYVKKIKDSWANTGCSILLDDWIDEKGRYLVSFFVECPQGVVYLRSANVTPVVDDVNALQLLLDKVIEDLGIENVIQIVSSTNSGWVASVGKQFMDKNCRVFWSMSLSYCIELMLEKIAAMDSITEALEKVRLIVKFIHSNAEVLKLMRTHTQMLDLVKPLDLKMAMAFLTLENIVSEKKSLKTMFASPDWLNSTWASTQEGQSVANIVNDPSFWTRADVASKGTVPLLRVLSMINEVDKPQTPYIYETMDQVKETIKEEFKSKKSDYIHFWNTIDEIWNTYLHSPLHAAGYYFNPALFYTNEFSMDLEVSMGLVRCLIRLIPNQRTQELILSQLDEYRFARGAFEEGYKTKNRTSISQDQWWSVYGKECPELQQFAIRIVSQTCDGPLRFGLKRDAVENLLKNESNVLEQQRLRELTWLHYNLNLQKKSSTTESESEAKKIVATGE